MDSKHGKYKIFIMATKLTPSCEHSNELVTLCCPQKDSKADDNICLDYIAGSSNLIVGNEKGCFVADIETNSLTGTYLFDAGKEVSSVCSDVADNPAVFFVSSENLIYVIDRRSSNLPQLLFSENEDEINQIKLNKNNILAACDDSGECKMFDIKAKKLYRTLRRKHTSICSSLSFIDSNPEIVLTAGLDSQLILWDFKRVKAQYCVDIQSVLKKMGDDSIYMFNPPLVHSIGVSKDILATGLGNGSVQLFTIYNKTKQPKIYPSLLINQHSSLGVSTLSFLKHSENSTETFQTLTTGGNDGIVNIWNLFELTPSRNIPTNSLLTADNTNCTLHTSRTLDSKINCVESVVVNDEKLVFIADQTSNVKMFKIT